MREARYISSCLASAPTLVIPAKAGTQVLFLARFHDENQQRVGHVAFSSFRGNDEEENFEKA